MSPYPQRIRLLALHILSLSMKSSRRTHPNGPVHSFVTLRNTMRSSPDRMSPLDGVAWSVFGRRVQRLWLDDSRAPLHTAIERPLALARVSPFAKSAAAAVSSTRSLLGIRPCGDDRCGSTDKRGSIYLGRGNDTRRELPFCTHDTVNDVLLDDSDTPSIVVAGCPGAAAASTTAESTLRPRRSSTTS